MKHPLPSISSPSPSRLRSESTSTSATAGGGGRGWSRSRSRYRDPSYDRSSERASSVGGSRVAFFSRSRLGVDPYTLPTSSSQFVATTGASEKRLDDADCTPQHFEYFEEEKSFEAVIGAARSRSRWIRRRGDVREKMWPLLAHYLGYRPIPYVLKFDFISSLLSFLSRLP